MLRAEVTGAEIARHLDALDPVERLRQVLAVKGKWVKALYDRVADGPPVTLEEFVPTSTTGTTLIYEGRNSLAMFTRFQKRFLRTQSGVIVGYNHQTWQWVTGPGYFVFQDADGQPPVPNEPVSKLLVGDSEKTLCAKLSSLTNLTLSPTFSVSFLIEKALFFCATTCSSAAAGTATAARAAARTRDLETYGTGTLLRFRVRNLALGKVNVFTVFGIQRAKVSSSVGLS